MFFWFVWKLMKIVCRLSLLWESRPLPTSWTLHRSQHKIPRGVLQSNDTCPEAASENVGYKWKYHKRQRLLSLYFCKGYQHIRIFEGSSDQGLGVKALKHQKLPATGSPYHSINDQLHETLDVFTLLQSISKKDNGHELSCGLCCQCSYVPDLCPAIPSPSPPVRKGRMRKQTAERNARITIGGKNRKKECTKNIVKDHYAFW